jgi:hypothetical protein
MTLTWPDAVLWGPSAVGLWLPNAPLPALGHIIGARSRHNRPAYRLVARRASLPADELATVGGLRVQNLQAALVDALAVMEPHQADDLFSWVLTRKKVNTELFAQAVSRRCGARGIPAARRYLDMAKSGAASQGELKAHALLRRAGITGWVGNAEIRVADGTIYQADIFFEAERVIAEVDGYAYHSGRQAFQRDRTKHNKLATAGYQVLHLTWEDITVNQARTAQTIRAALRRADSR